MHRLDREPEVVELSRALGLLGRPVASILDFCRRRIGGWMAEEGGAKTIRDLEALAAQRLRMVFEEFETEEELDALIRKYVSMGEKGFASLRIQFGEETFGSLMERRNVSGEAPDRYAAFIDCRGEKAARRFFTRWHEIAHLMTLTRQVELPVHRSARHPIERLMEEIAGHLGFFEPLFEPVLRKHHGAERLTFEAVEAIRSELCEEASFQATLFACLRRLPSPIVYIEAAPTTRKNEFRLVKIGEPVHYQLAPAEPKLRIRMSVPNPAASLEGLYIVRNMRPPEPSVVFRLFHSDEEEACGRENLSSLRFSAGGSLGDREVWDRGPAPSRRRYGYRAGGVVSGFRFQVSSSKFRVRGFRL